MIYPGNGSNAINRIKTAIAQSLLIQDVGETLSCFHSAGYKLSILRITAYEVGWSPPMSLTAGRAREVAASCLCSESLTVSAGHVSLRMLAHYSHVRLANWRRALDPDSSRSSRGGYVTELGTIGHSEDSGSPQVTVSDPPHRLNVWWT